MHLQLILSALAASAAFCFVLDTPRTRTVQANFGANGTIAEYTTSGLPVNFGLVSRRGHNFTSKYVDIL
jgi:hypothetical protein